MTFLEVTDC